MVLPNVSNNQTVDGNDFNEEILVKTADGRFKVITTGNFPESFSGSTEVGADRFSAPAAINVSDNISSPPGNTGDINALFERVKAAVELPNNEVEEARSRKIIIAYLKDVRDYLETKEVLRRPFKVGGLNLPEEVAVKVLAIIDQYKNSSVAERKGNNLMNNDQREQSISPAVFTLEDKAYQITRPVVKAVDREKFQFKPEEELLLPPPPPMVIPLPEQPLDRVKRPLSRPVKPVDNKLPGRIIPAIDRPVAKPINFFSRKETKFMTVSDKSAENSVKTKIVPEAAKDQSADTSLSESMSLPKNSARGVVSRPAKMTKSPVMDIKSVSPLVGPLEEIGRLSLTDFRRLNADPEAATMKVRDKILLLGQESFTAKVAAIRAWQNSEVYRLYLMLGGESIKGNRSLHEIIAAREKTGEKTLREDEFKAIMKLNRQLKF